MPYDQFVDLWGPAACTMVTVPTIIGVAPPSGWCLGQTMSLNLITAVVGLVLLEFSGGRADMLMTCLI